MQKHQPFEYDPTPPESEESYEACAVAQDIANHQVQYVPQSLSARVASDRMPPAIRHPRFIPLSERGYSPYRKRDAQDWLDMGFADFAVVAKLTQHRGAPYARTISREKRAGYVVICRPASTGTWGKSVEHRAIPLEVFLQQ